MGRFPDERATRSTLALWGGRSKSELMPNAWSSGRTARSSVSMPGPLGAEKPSMTRFTISRRSSASPARSGTEHRSSNGSCRRHCGAFSASWAACRTATASLSANVPFACRPTDGRYPRRGSDRWPGGRRSRLCRSCERERALVCRCSQHPRPAPRAGNPRNHRDTGSAAPELRAGCRLHAL